MATKWMGSLVLPFLFLSVANAQTFNVPSAVTVNCPTGTATQSGSVITCPSSGIPQCPSPPGTGPCNIPQCPSPPGSGPCDSKIVCQGFDKTLVIDVPWAQIPRLFTSSYGGFGPNDALVLRFTAGSIPNPANATPKFLAAEYGSEPSSRASTLSPRYCDWSQQPNWGANSGGYSVNLPFLVNAETSPTGYFATVPFNTTYYVNVKNAPNAACVAGWNCNMYIDFLKPPGM